MQRRELQKAIRRYAKEVNFHKYGLIRQLYCEKVVRGLLAEGVGV